MHEERYYTELAAAFVQGKLGAMPHLSPDEIIRQGLAAGLCLHKFKRNAELPRVRKALGMLHGLAPETLLDVGSHWMDRPILPNQLRDRCDIFMA